MFLKEKQMKHINFLEANDTGLLLPILDDIPIVGEQLIYDTSYSQNGKAFFADSFNTLVNTTTCLAKEENTLLV